PLPVANSLDADGIAIRKTLQNPHCGRITLAMPIKPVAFRITLMLSRRRVCNRNAAAFFSRLIRWLPDWHGVRHHQPAGKFGQCGLVLSDDYAGKTLLYKSLIHV